MTGVVRATDGAVDAGGAIHNLEGKLDAEAFPQLLSNHLTNSDGSGHRCQV